jgi:OmcA/MtrC family decaheme c-type cytochrome
MNTWRWGVAAGVIASATVLGLASCGDDDNNNQTSTTTPPQISPDPVTLEIQSATVPEFGTTARPTVTFRILDGNNNPIDVLAELATTTTFPNLAASGARAPTFTIAMLNGTDDYVSYYTTLAVSRASYTYFPSPEVLGTTNLATFVPPLGTYSPASGLVTLDPATMASTQATSVASARSTITLVGDRTYQFTFPQGPPSNIYSTSGMDRTKSHRVAGWVVRKPNPTDSDIGHDALDFVPASAGSTARKIETITNDGCNRCHGALTAHGTRRGVEFCVTCHSPQTGDPETGRTVDFKVMIHRLHYGGDQPTVLQGQPYFIVGFNGSVADFSDIAFPWHDHGVGHCTACHQGADQDRWRQVPTLQVCTSCHANVKFSGTLAPCPTGSSTDFADCLHQGGPIAVTNPSDPNACLGCHGPGTVAAIDKFHHGDD